MARRRSLASYRCLAVVPLLACAGAAPAAAAPPAPGYEGDTSLPVLIPDEAWRPLDPSPEPGLTGRLEERLGEVLRWRRLLETGKLAVGVVDLARLEQPRYASLNGDTMMYAASLPKIALLLAAEQALADGHLEESPELRQDLHDMIRVSSNPAASRVYDRLGFPRVVKVLESPRYALFDPREGGLWIGKPYAREGDRHPDPVKGLVHGATVRQVCRFYYLLLTGRLVSPGGSRAMLDSLFWPTLPYKFACSLEQRAPDASLYRKSGTWRVWHSDSVLVWQPGGRRYILAALVEDPAGSAILEALLPAVEEVLYPGGRDGGHPDDPAVTPASRSRRAGEPTR